MTGQAGRHDPMARRKTRRSGRERGAWLYVPAEALQRAGVDPAGPEPYYRVWAGKGGSVVVRLYRAQ